MLKDKSLPTYEHTQTRPESAMALERVKIGIPVPPAQGSNSYTSAKIQNMAGKIVGTLLTARDVSAISPRQASYKPTDGQQQESKPGAPIPKSWLLSLLCPSSQLSRKLQTWFCVMVDHRHGQCAGSVFKAAVPWVVTPHHLKLGERAEWLFSSGTASSPRSCPLPPQSHRSNK